MTKLIEAWDAHAKIWDSFAENPKNYYHRRTRFVAELILKNVEHTGSVLEGACGVGLLCLMLARNGFDVYGYDISMEMVNSARKRLNRELGIDSDRFRVCKGEEVPFGSVIFDVVVFLDFPYIRDYDSYVKSLSKHLRKGGYLAVACVKRRSLYVCYAILRHILKLGRVPDWRSTFLNLIRTGYWSGGYLDYRTAKQAYNARSFDRIFQKNGFSKVDEFALYFPHFDRNPLRRSRFNKFLARNLGRHYIGIYQRS